MASLFLLSPSYLYISQSSRIRASEFFMLSSEITIDSLSPSAGNCWPRREVEGNVAACDETFNQIS